MSLLPVNYFFIFIFITRSCVSKVIRVSNSEDLKAALIEVSPGDSISLSGNTTFHGTFTASRNGSRALPITILTENFEKTFHAKIVGEGMNKAEAAFTISGDYYNLENLKIINNNSLALLVEGTDTSLEGVMIQDAERAVKIQGARSYMKDCYISQVRSGIQVEGDFSVVRDTFVTGDGIVSLVAEKITCCGTLMGNVFDGKVDIKGTDYNLFDNLIEGRLQ